MTLHTTYLGLDLKSPLVVSSNPLTESVDNIKRMEDNGAAAVVLYSLFEEQLRIESRTLEYYLSNATHSYAEALTYFPEPQAFRGGPDGYLNHIRKAKEAVDIPIIASLNGSTPGGWTRFARLIEEVGADALELNVYSIPTEMYRSGDDVELRILNTVQMVKSAVKIPVAVKLGPYFSSFANMAYRLDKTGVDGVVLFNRFYQPDINLETLEITPNVLLSTPQDLRLPLTWIGILYTRIQANMAATSGIHTAEDVIKLLLVGADVTMMASALLRHGIPYLKTIERDLYNWLEVNGYSSVAQLRGSMSQVHAEDPGAFERAQYMRAITHFPQENAAQQSRISNG